MSAALIVEGFGCAKALSKINRLDRWLLEMAEMGRLNDLNIISTTMRRSNDRSQTPSLFFVATCMHTCKSSMVMLYSRAGGRDRKTCVTSSLWWVVRNRAPCSIWRVHERREESSWRSSSRVQHRDVLALILLASCCVFCLIITDRQECRHDANFHNSTHGISSSRPIKRRTESGGVDCQFSLIKIVSWSVRLSTYLSKISNTGAHSTWWRWNRRPKSHQRWERDSSSTGQAW